MASPYQVGGYPWGVFEGGELDIDAQGYPGTAYLFPLNEQTGQNLEVNAALNALFFDDPSRWPTAHYPATSGSAVPLGTKMVEDPDLRAVVNWLAYRDQDQKFIPDASYWETLCLRGLT